MDGNGVVNILDVKQVKTDYSAGKVANRIDDAYSWYTSGGGDYKMWQWLDSDAVQAVAGRTITFGFWFLPEFIPSGSESEPLGQATSTSGWYCGRELTYAPPPGKSVILRKVQLDVYVEGGGRGYYKITYQKAGEDETLLVSDQEVTNTVQETRTHDVFVWGNEGQSITVYFYIGRYQGSGMIWSRNHYMYYQVPVPARAEIYYEYAGGSNTVYGIWVAPTEIEWNDAYITANLPSTTTAVKVVIHGTSDFKAYIDSASLSIFDYETKEEPGRGKLTLGVNVYEWHIIGGAPQPNGKVFLLPTLYAESSSMDYKIRWIELKVELLPNDGSSATQDGFIDIRYCAQENNEGHDIEPDSSEGVQAQTLESLAQLITFGTSIFVGIGVGIITGGPGAATIPLVAKVFASTSLSTTAGAVIVYILQQFASEPIDEHAQMGTDYFVRERWNYPTYYREWEPEPFVESASGQYTLDWTFNTASASSFQIKVTATVNWGEVVYHYQYYSWWDLIDAGSTTISKTITIHL